MSYDVSSCNTEYRKKTGISTVQCSSLFLYPSKTSDRASTVLERAYYTV